MSLTSVTIPNSVTSIGHSAFAYCSGLTSLTIPNSVTSMDYYAFAYCTKLKSVTIPNSVRVIRKGVFYNCGGPIDVYLDTSLCPLDEVFSGSTFNVTIGNSITKIKRGVFQNCNELRNVIIPNPVTTIESSAFSYSGLSSIAIPNSITTIEGSTFSGCKGLLDITIPNSVTSIGNSAFCECSGLTDLTIGNSVTTIGNEAFKGCSGLTNVTIGENVSSIGSQAFYNCYRISHVYSLNPVPPTISNSEIFLCPNNYVRDKYDVYNYAMLHVPKGSIEDYSTAHDWRYFNRIKEDAETVGVGSLSLEDVKVTGGDGEISIEHIDKPTDVYVYSVGGKLIARESAASGSINLQVPKGQLYIVKVGGRTYKVVM